MLSLSRYHEKIAVVCPIHGIRNNRGVLSFDPTGDATPEQIQDANNLLGTFDIQADQAKEDVFNTAVAAGHRFRQDHPRNRRRA